MISKHSISIGFHGLTGCQKDPRDRGVTPCVVITTSIETLDGLCDAPKPGCLVDNLSTRRIFVDVW